MRIVTYFRTEVREGRTWVLCTDFGITWWQELDVMPY